MGDKKKIFITGASGFLGLPLINILISTGYEVHVLSRRSNEFWNKFKREGLNIIKGDLLSIENFKEIICRCDYFVHLAGEKSNTELMQKTNVVGMQKVISVLASASHLKFIYCSSTGVYGLENHPALLINEQSACFPNNQYERTKYRGEELLNEFGKLHINRYSILRPSNVFGVDDPQKKLLNVFRAMKSGRFLYTDDNAKLNYINVNQVADCILKMIEKDLFFNDTYNINAVITMKDFIIQAKSSMSLSANFLRIPKQILFLLVLFFGVVPKSFRLINQLKYRELTNNKVFSSTKIEAALNLNLKDGALLGISQLINYYQKHKWL